MDALRDPPGAAWRSVPMDHGPGAEAPVECGGRLLLKTGIRLGPGGGCGGQGPSAECRIPERRYSEAEPGVALCCHEALVSWGGRGQGCIGRGGRHPPLWGAQPTPSHCPHERQLPAGICNRQ